MKFCEAMGMWLPFFLVPRFKLVCEPISDSQWPRRAIKAFGESFVSQFDVGQRGQLLLHGRFKIVRIDSRSG